MATDKDILRARHRERGRAATAQRRARYANNPDAFKAQVAVWQRANAARVRPAHTASQAVYRALKRGLLVRPSRCSLCNRSLPLEAAHSDYTKPLKVIWLCRPCHRWWDHRHPKTRREAAA